MCKKLIFLISLVFTLVVISGMVIADETSDQDEVPAIVKATEPDPADGTADLPRWATLSWTPGDYADNHNVYFSDSFDDVNNASADALVSEGQLDATYDVTGLDYGTTYYWRIDEVNEIADANDVIYPGDVWSLSTKAIGLVIPESSITATASSQLADNQGPTNTINKSGLDENDQHSFIGTDMWFSASTTEPNKAWIQYDFDKLYKLPIMLIWNYNALGLFMNCAIKGVTIEYSVDGVNWITLEGVTELLPGDGNAEIIDLGGVADGIAASSIRITANSNYTDGLFSFFGLSEVRFYAVDVWPKNPVPANGATGIDPVLTLSWTPGEGSVEHQIYLDTDEQAVIDGTAPCYTVMDPSLDMVLSLETQYYWRVVEVNMASEPNDWSGPSWSFTTSAYRVVDDFESYKTSLQNWKGGNSASGNGAAIALETSKAKSGSKSMKFMYDNTVTSNGTEGHSTIFVDPSKLACGKDWTKGDPAYLVFWYYGDLDNATTEEMCVSFNDAIYRIVTPISEIRTPWWTQVTIPFNYGQVDFTKVTAFSIGFYRYNMIEGDGMIYVDDIRLYKNPPVPIVPEDPGKSNLVALYKMENNVKDSSGNGINGTALGDPNYVDGPFRTYGMALEFDANDDVVDLGPADPFNFTGSFSISFFANMKTWNAMWQHAIIATRGEDGIGFQVRHGYRGYLAFTTRGIATPGFFGGGGDQFARQALATGEWTHIVCVFDADNATKSVYYDGDLIVQETATGLLTPSTTNASIGARANGDNTGFDALFNGNLDDVRVYDKALSEAEVRFLMDPTP